MIKSVMFFRNGNTAIFDEHGQQDTHLQEPWILVYMDYLRRHGVETEGLDISMPDGRRAIIDKMTDDNYTWRVT